MRNTKLMPDILGRRNDNCYSFPRNECTNFKLRKLTNTGAPVACAASVDASRWRLIKCEMSTFCTSYADVTIVSKSGSPAPTPLCRPAENEESDAEPTPLGDDTVASGDAAAAAAETGNASEATSRALSAGEADTKPRTADERANAI